MPRSNNRYPPRIALGTLVSGAAAAAIPLLAVGLPAGQAPSAAAVPADEAMARAACTSCHAFPPPDSLPRARWNATVIEMTALALSGIGAPRNAPPPTLDFDPDLIARFYEARAPESLAAPAPRTATCSTTSSSSRTTGSVGSRTAAAWRSRSTSWPTSPESTAPLPWTSTAAGTSTWSRPRSSPHRGAPRIGPAAPAASLVWLEQVSRGRFERRTLETGGQHVTVDAADYDGDGDIDLVVGNFALETQAWVEVWENLRVSGAKPATQAERRPPATRGGRR